MRFDIETDFRRRSLWTLMNAILFMNVCQIEDGDGAIMINAISDEITGLYRGPSSYGGSSENHSSDVSKKRPLPSFIITSRPLLFSQENSANSGASSAEKNTNRGGSSSATFKYRPWLQQRPSTASAHSSKVSLTFLPGKATVVCKGMTCSQPGLVQSPSSDLEFFGSAVAADDDGDHGFAGEAIPIDGGEDFATVVLSEKQPVLLPVTAKPERPVPNPSLTQTSTVHLLTKRPYLNRVKPTTTKRSTSPPTRKRSTTSAVRRRTLRATSSTSTTTSTPIRRRPVANSPSATTRPPPQAAPLIRPTGGGRPSFFFPAAMTAFTLMALPVAAAAFPFFLNGRKRRSSDDQNSAIEKIMALQRGDNFESLVHELEKILEKDADSRISLLDHTSNNATLGNSTTAGVRVIRSDARNTFDNVLPPYVAEVEPDKTYKADKAYKADKTVPDMQT